MKHDREDEQGSAAFLRVTTFIVGFLTCSWRRRTKHMSILSSWKGPRVLDDSTIRTTYIVLVGDYIRVVSAR